jgi:hypothetical protein
MGEISLAEKYKFNEKYLANYRPNDEFPGLGFVKDKIVVANPEHPLADFMQFYIDNVIRFLYEKDGVLGDIIEPAWREREFLNRQLGVPQLCAPTPDEMREKGYFGAMDRLKTYAGELERAIAHTISKRVPPAEWPLKCIIEQKVELDERIKRIMDAEGEPNFVLYVMD